MAERAARLASAPHTQRRVGEKKARRERDEAGTPLRAYRERELAEMRRTFFDPDAPYHALRTAFVTKGRGAARPAGPAPYETPGPGPHQEPGQGSDRGPDQSPGHVPESVLPAAL